MVLLRKLFFEFDCGHTQSLQAPIYGIPVAEFQRDVTFKPQVKLVFRERYPTGAARTAPGRGEITFRLMNETASTYTETKAKALARAIKQEFATPLFVWEKGKYYYHYRDAEKGYHLRLLVNAKSEGERIAKKVLSIQNHTFSAQFVDFVDNDKVFPANPGTQLVYGKQVGIPRKRPSVDVRFRHAQLLLNGRLAAINLVSTQESALKSVLERVIAN
ncbi:MAG TPA: hypothetical protein VE956_20075 [Nodularia sp. (in: cyanobacteria)]|nr:hypothetical protein [Nodularia sp. (in: cyanobacteria)]